MTQNKSLQRTHLHASEELIGTVESIETGQYSRVSIAITDRMKVDEKGLAHGGFTFGLADYAAMVAVNDPFVVLLSSTVKFMKPVVVGDRLTAEARITETDGRKRKALCEVFNQKNERVFEGEFLCLVLGKHILEK
jgi:uncharacterized protein (TIGR00369 family)